MEPTLFLWVMLLLALLVPGRPAAVALYFCGGLYLLARLSLIHAAARVTVQRSVSDTHIFLGEEVTIAVKLANPTRIPLPWLQFSESRPAQLTQGPLSRVAALGAQAETSATYTLHGSKRGRYQVGPLRFWTGDPFGFLRLEAGSAEQVEFTVYPRPLPLPEIGLPARLPMGDLATRRRLFEDPAWFSSTRPYEPGDSMRRVHWGATARAGELMVKQFRHSMLLPACVAVNLSRSDYEGRNVWQASELAITAAASLTQHLVNLKQQVALLAVGEDPDAAVDVERGAVAPNLGAWLPLRQGQGAMMAVLDLLARIQVTEGLAFATALTARARELPWGSLFCIISPTETPEIAAAAAALVRGGQQVLLFLTDEAAPLAPGGVGYRTYRLTEKRGEVALQ